MFLEFKTVECSRERAQDRLLPTFGNECRRTYFRIDASLLAYQPVTDIDRIERFQVSQLYRLYLPLRVGNGFMKCISEVFNNGGIVFTRKEK
jgi:hypothetical protein